MKNIMISVIVLVLLGAGFYFISMKKELPETNPFMKDGTSANLETTNPNGGATNPETNPFIKGGTSAGVEGINGGVIKTPSNEAVMIDIKDFKFNPSPLEITAGTTVTWTNSDSAPHTVTSDSGSVLNSVNLSQGQTFSYTFKTAGTFDYHCAVHPMMKGRVVVK